MSPAALVKRSPLGAYFVLVFGIEWVLFVALLAGFIPALPPLLILLLASWSPDLVGVLVTATSDGRAGLGALFRRVVRWRVGVAWYAVALFVPAMVALGATLLSPIVSGPAPSFAQPDQWFGIVVVGLVTGAIGEELGWRGTALPRLLTRWSALTSSLLLGSLWGL